MIDIIYEDDFIIGINKKSGVLVTPNNRDDKNNLTQYLAQFLLKRGDKYKAHPCHRLDKDTSGAIIFSKGKKNQKIFMELFHSNKIKKLYIALIRGHLKNKNGKINFKIENKEAITNYEVLEEKKDYSVVGVELLTGRTNQIRIHFNMLGHPLLGEYKYAFRKDFNIKFPRVALHSLSIQFIHPILNKSIEILAPIPDDINKMID